MANICDISDVLTWLEMGASATRTDRGKIGFLIPLAEDAIRQHIGYTVTQASYTHFLPESDLTASEDEEFDVTDDRVIVTHEGDSSVLHLPERPVRTITTVHEDTSAYAGQGATDFSGSALTAGTDYYLDYTTSGVSWSGKLIRIGSTWPSRMRTVKVAYTAGLTAAEIDARSVNGPDGAGIGNLKMAAVLAVSAWFQESKQVEGGKTGGLVAERLADWSRTYSKGAVASLQMQLPQKSIDLLRAFRRLAI